MKEGCVCSLEWCHILRCSLNRESQTISRRQRDWYEPEHTIGARKLGLKCLQKLCEMLLVKLYLKIGTSDRKNLEKVPGKTVCLPRQHQEFDPKLLGQVSKTFGNFVSNFAPFLGLAFSRRAALIRKLTMCTEMLTSTIPKTVFL